MQTAELHGILLRESYIVHAYKMFITPGAGAQYIVPVLSITEWPNTKH